MKFIYLFSVFICLLVSGCSSPVSPKAALETELHSEIHAFYQAVLDKNSDAVYTYLSADLGDRYDKPSFKAYFTENYDIFLEYAEMIEEDDVAFEISSQPRGDVCGSLQMEFDENGDWKLSSLPGKLFSVEEQKQNIIHILQSNTFSLALNEYGERHPELNGAQQRTIRRKVQSESISPDNVHFSGNQVVITLPETAVIRMECASKAWRLVQCSLLH